MPVTLDIILNRVSLEATQYRLTQNYSTIPRKMDSRLLLSSLNRVSLGAAQYRLRQNYSPIPRKMDSRKTLKENSSEQMCGIHITECHFIGSRREASPPNYKKFTPNVITKLAYKEARQPITCRTHNSCPSIFFSACFAILNFCSEEFRELITYLLMKNLIPVRRDSYSGVTAIRENAFHTILSGNSKMASKSIRKCIILFGVNWRGSLRSTILSAASERLKEATISAVNFARCIDLISGIVSSSL